MELENFGCHPQTLIFLAARQAGPHFFFGMINVNAAAVKVGQVVIVLHVNESGLPSESALHVIVREAHATLWIMLDASSCLINGPPGSGKSTAVWLWLIE